MTFIAVDFFDIVDLDKFDFVTFQKDAKLEYKVLLQMTHDIIILELVHRVVVCIFEAFWLQGGANGRLGGATPGKSLMGLRVISCQSSTPLPGRQQADEVVVVRPGTDLGLTTSLIRAVVKNLVVTFLIPAGFAFLYFRHNRTGYDIICNTIVVQEPLVPHRTTATNTATTNAQT
ncbi:hypothetical protein AAG570_002287 [Ranatra chinensis]|uniref:Protein FAM8A1 n=1 Tax=Ranatra chinensis TaxID=642074 RepID=A0ABD0Y730_9HEMI